MPKNYIIKYNDQSICILIVILLIVIVFGCTIANLCINRRIIISNIIIMLCLFIVFGVGIYTLKCKC